MYPGRVGGGEASVWGGETGRACLQRPALARAGEETRSTGQRVSHSGGEMERVTCLGRSWVRRVLSDYKALLESDVVWGGASAGSCT